MLSNRFATVMGEARLAYLHVGLPLGVFSEFVQEIHRVLQEVLDLGSDIGTGAPRVEYLFVAGEGDLCVRLELPNFRQMAEIQTALNLRRETSAVLGRERSASWKFSLPVDVDIDRKRSGRLHGPALRFISHLRIRRELYVDGGTEFESAALEGVLATATECADDLWADVEIGLGWADFLVTGETTSTGPNFYRFLRGLRELRTEGGDPVFQKTVTVLGMPCDEAGQIRWPDFEVEQALCLVRSQAGSFDKAHDALVELADLGADQPSPIRVLDGRNDLCLLREARPGQSDFIERLHRLATRKENPLSEAIERMQTHLLVGLPAPVGLKLTSSVVAFKSSRLEPLRKNRKLEDGYLSDLLARISARVLDLRELQILDKRLVLGVSTALSALRRAVADDLNHYDTRLAIVSVLEGGLSLLAKIGDFHAAHEAICTSRLDEPAMVDVYREPWSSSLAQAKKDLLEWCHLTERVLGERLTGSYDDFFGESGSPSPRGGLQKVNFLADAIIQAYVDLLPSSYASGERKHRRYFAAVFESISLIGSIPGVGLISLPIKFRFALPRATPHILHEVSMLLFYQRFPSPYWPATKALSDDERARAQFLEDRSREVVALREAAWREREADFRRFIEKQPLTASFHDWRARYLQEAAQEDSPNFTLDDLQPLDQIKLFEEIAESVSDVLVCAYGFGGLRRIKLFVRDLTLLFIERAREISAADGSGPSQLYRMLLFRLLVVSETLAWLEPNPPKKSRQYREEMLFELAKMIDEVLQSPRFIHGLEPRPPFPVFGTLAEDERPEAVRLALRKISSATYEIYFTPFLEDLQASIEQDEGRRRIQEVYGSEEFHGWTDSLARGQIVKLRDTASIVPCYLELLSLEHAHWLNSEGLTRAFDPHARHRAALARSAVLSSFVQSGGGRTVLEGSN